MSFTVLGLLCLLQAWPSSTQFVFEFELVSVATIDSDTCDIVLPADVELLGPCEPFLSIFCLREGTNTQNNDTGYCPLGRNDAGIVAYTPGVDLDVDRFNATRPGLPNGPVNRIITSQHSWPGTFQLYIEARELDPCCNVEDNVHLDGILINEMLEVNAGFTPIERYNGTSTRNRVVLDMRFRVMCQQDYYGPDCTRLCRAQNDSVNGYYTCNSDGSIQCREGFRNISNNCTEAIVACDSSPCANGGSCTSMGAFNFTYQCAVGYTGSTCEVNIDDCVSATCPSNSMCVDGVNSFECTCLPGFMEISGRCELLTNTACDSSPCANDGSCTSMGAFNFICQCAVGYTGSTCEVNIDDCVSATCPSNSMCVDGVNSYECTCLPGFENSNNRSCVMVLQTENHTGPKLVTIEVIIGVASSAALIIGILIIVIVVLSVLVIKGRKPHCDHQYTCQATDRDIKTKPNESYGLVSGHMTGYHDHTSEALV